MNDENRNKFSTRKGCVEAYGRICVAQAWAQTQAIPPNTLKSLERVKQVLEDCAVKGHISEEELQEVDEKLSVVTARLPRITL